MFDDIFNHDNDNGDGLYFRKWFIDPSKLFKSSMSNYRNTDWVFGTPQKKPRIENVCVAELDDREQKWYNALLERQKDVTNRINYFQRQLNRAQLEQSILDIDTLEFNNSVRKTHNLGTEQYPELIVGEDGKHVYQQVDLSNNSEQ